MSDKSKIYTLPTGDEIEIKPVNALAIQHLSTVKGGMPKRPLPPRVQVGTKKNGKPRYELNPDDPDYKQALIDHQTQVKNWENEKNLKLVQYILDRGVATEPPIEYLNDNQAYLSDMTDGEIKYFWLIDSLSDEQELQDLTEFIMSQTVPTEEGVEEAMSTFHADGERDTTSDLVSVQTTS